MSMPTFPESGLDITEEQAFNMLLASIAMEELALSHIMNAEGEKLQYVLGTLPGKHGGCATTQELLEINQSITRLLEMVMHNQLLLKGKLDRVLECRRPQPPAPPPPPPCCHTALKKDPAVRECTRLLAARPHTAWQKNTCFQWQEEVSQGRDARLCPGDACRILLAPGCTFSLQLCMELSDICSEMVSAVLSLNDSQGARPIQRFEACGNKLSGSVLLSTEHVCESSLFLCLGSPHCISVETASLLILPSCPQQ